MPAKSNAAWPPFVDLLLSGGDARIGCGTGGVNKYGCAPTPQPDILSYSSSTASSISTRGFAAADALYQRLAGAEPTPELFANEMQRIRRELAALCELRDDNHIFLGASGTDMHRIAAQAFRAATSKPLTIIMSEPAETGSGIPEALAENGENSGIVSIASRTKEGHLRPETNVDSEVIEAVEHAMAAQHHVLLLLTDISKTGLIIPSAACALALKQRYPDTLDVLVDACQFRLTNATISAYLAQGFLLTITGSKFVGGPAFSAALLLPRSATQRLQNHTEVETVNWGLLLRIEAALAELRALRTLSEEKIQSFLEKAADSILRRFTSDSTFLPLPIRALDRAPLASNAWDTVTTIFPFLLRHASGVFFTREETMQLYQCMQQDMREHSKIPPEIGELAAKRCFLGQPVMCGTRDGISLSALRLNIDARLIVDALSPEGRGAEAVITEALLLLDKAALLAKYLF